MDIDALPSSGETVYAYCKKYHVLTNILSTLNSGLERLLVLGSVAMAANAKVPKYINKVNTGARTVSELFSWAQNKMSEYRADLDRITIPPIAKKYPR